MNIDEQNLYDYHKHNSVYISDYIKFADAKAGVAVGANFLMLGFFGNEVKSHNLLEISWTSSSFIIGLISLAIACYFFIWKVLWPRYSNSTVDYMSWGGIGSFKRSQHYQDKINSLNTTELLNDLSRQNYLLSKVCLQKYKNLKFGFLFLTIGAIILSIGWLVLY